MEAEPEMAGNDADDMEVEDVEAAEEARNAKEIVVLSGEVQICKFTGLFAQEMYELEDALNKARKSKKKDGDDNASVVGSIPTFATGATALGPDG